MVGHSLPSCACGAKSRSCSAAGRNVRERVLRAGRQNFFGYLMQSVMLSDALETVVACGGVGALIDFWIGRTGQDRVREWLTEWWIRLSYVRWGNFGRK